MNFKKIFAAALAALSLGFAVVHSNSQAQTAQSAANVETVLGFAKLKSVHAPTQGTVAIVKKLDGTTVLRLQNLKTEAGPDLHVYLYGSATPAESTEAKTVKAVKYLDLGKLPAPFAGFYEYAIPAGTNLDGFKSAIIWCDLAGVTFAGANF